MSENFMEMSDEEFLNSATPESVEATPVEEDTSSEEEETTPVTEVEESKEEEQEVSAEPNSEEPNEEEQESSQEATVPEIDYKAQYEKVMAPFKANGKTIQLNNTDEVISLLQKGANYTHKMQELAPKRKLLKMLEANGLTSEQDLELLLEVRNKNPEAIKKFMKDNEINPLDIDTDGEIKYQAGNQLISDKQMQFDSVLEELQNADGGYDVIAELNKWDEHSKAKLWDNPEDMRFIYQQKKSGVYDLISDEIEHQRMLGNIPPSTSFYDAYMQVGNYLLRQQNERAKQPIATGLAPQKQTVNNAERIKATTPVKVAKASSPTLRNPWEMSDEEFMKLFNR